MDSIGWVLVIFKRNDKDATVVTGSVGKWLVTNGQRGYPTTDDAEDLVVFKFLDALGVP